MPKEITNNDIYQLGVANGYAYKNIKSIITVESGQHGFDSATGKIIIRPEKSWFQRLDKDWRTEAGSKTWQANQVGDQAKNWKVFNSMYDSDPTAAMLSTSIGMPQLMGFHHLDCGFSKVGPFWEFMKQSEYNQIVCMIRWIKTVPALDAAIKEFNPPKIAYYYNGQNFKKYNYDSKLIAAHRLTEEFVPLKNVA
jgi:hypothetical protein